jgi:hypothetical protein
MTDPGIGRLLVASLHQGIADLLPTRLEFYEGWINPAGLRDGRIGIAPLTAVLSFLRQEGPPYWLVSTRAGEYTAEWIVADMPGYQRSILRALHPRIRIYFVAGIARRLVRATYGGSRATVRWRGGQGAINIRGSIFCEVRDRVEQPLCAFYAAAVRRLMTLFGLEAEVEIERCRATGAGECFMTLLVRQLGAAR